MQDDDLRAVVPGAFVSRDDLSIGIGADRSFRKRGSERASWLLHDQQDIPWNNANAAWSTSEPSMKSLARYSDTGSVDQSENSATLPFGCFDEFRHTFDQLIGASALQF